MPKQYEKLNDAPNLRNVGPIEAVTIEVWYMTPDFFPQGISGAKPNHDPKNLHWTHILLGTIQPRLWQSVVDDNVATIQESLQATYNALQGENWSPDGEARELIQEKGLRHTSMSVGDCFKLPNGEVWIVAPTGFTKLGTENLR